MQTIIAKPLIKLNKERKITPKENNGKIFLMITPKRYIGSGKTLEEAIQDANLRCWSTGYFIGDPQTA